MCEPVVIDRDSDGETVTVVVRPAREWDEEGRIVETERESP